MVRLNYNDAAVAVKQNNMLKDAKTLQKLKEAAELR